MQPILTERLVLRNWTAEDATPFIAMNQDKRVMTFFPNVLSAEESSVFIQKIVKHIEEHDFGLYACALRETNNFIGFVGLNIPTFETHFTPCVEIGWRLAHEYWGNGYATEAAKTILKIGFGELNLKEIVSFTALQNLRSRHVMEKLGMKHHEKEDFNHPNLSSTHPLSSHVLYRLSQKEFLKQR